MTWENWQRELERVTQCGNPFRRSYWNRVDFVGAVHIHRGHNMARILLIDAFLDLERCRGKAALDKIPKHSIRSVDA